MRTMYDACNPARIPRTATMVAGYLVGNCAWSEAAWITWSHARQVRIATIASLNEGQVLDVERGDATPELAVGWCARARARGQTPTVYCSSSNVEAVLEACELHRVAAPLLWVAHWDGVAELEPGWVAKQHTNDAAGGYDVSCAADYWPGVDPVPDPPAPTPEDTDMWLYQAANGTIYAMDGGHRIAFQHSADVEVYIGQGVKLYLAEHFTADWNATILAKYPAL